MNIIPGRLDSPAVIQLLQGHLDDMYAKVLIDDELYQQALAEPAGVAELISVI